VTVNFAGRQETLAAVSNGSLPIASGEKVKVRAVVDGGTLEVEPL
jgi:F0F1-type ATP synthase epsilon subunit